MEEVLKIWLACQGDMSGEEFSQLMNTFGTAVKTIEAVEKYLGKGVDSKDCPPAFVKLRPKLLNGLDIKLTDKILANFEKSYKAHEVRGLVVTDEEYPAELREIKDAPSVLFVKGNLKLINNSRALRIAMVGARNCSEYGSRAAQAIAGGLAERGAIIISGMAMGIDTAAHRGALEAEGKTVAVLGTGILNIYPASNRSIYERIAETGAVISEFPPSLKALPYNFPRRNRIISGLSKGVVVVEAGMKSGSLITVDYALSQGRDVFAVPGNINSLTSKGTNFLIKQGANIVLRPADVLEEYGIFEPDERWGDEARKSAENKTECCGEEFEKPMPTNIKKICEQIGKKPLSLDELSVILSINSRKLLITMGEMGMLGLVFKQQGRYVLSKFDK